MCGIDKKSMTDAIIIQILVLVVNQKIKLKENTVPSYTYYYRIVIV